VRDCWQPSTLITTISRTDPYIANPKSILSTATPSALGEKIGELWSTNKNVLLAHSDPPSWHFSADYISALGGCCPLIFLHALQIDQTLLAHTTTGTGVPPPKNFNREHLKFGLNFCVWATKTSGLMEVSSQNLFQATCREVGVIKWVQLLEGRPLKFWRKKKRLKFCAISDNFRLWSRIFPERIHTSQIGRVFYQLQPLLRWVKKNLANFGPQTKTF